MDAFDRFISCAPDHGSLRRALIQREHLRARMRAPPRAERTWQSLNHTRWERTRPGPTEAYLST